MSNLLSILGACTGRDPEACADGYKQYGPLKSDTADAVVELLRPIQARYRELAADPAGTAALLGAGAAKARSIAGPTLARAQGGSRPHLSCRRHVEQVVPRLVDRVHGYPPQRPLCRVG